MKIDKTLIAVLMMVKDEEENIKITLNSIKNYFKNLIIFDTGSTDNTVKNIKKICSENNIKLHLKQGTFKSFPESRNESIKFAESIKVKFLLIMDAGDEFHTILSKNKFLQFIHNIPNDINYFFVKRKILVKNNQGIEENNQHKDYRFIRNNSNCRYDLDIPVHEAFSNVDKFLDMDDIIILFQDRIKCGASTINRHEKDIELLLKAKPTKRNLYYLAQTYMNINDFENGYKYNILSLESKDNTAPIDEKFIYVRIGFCAIMTNKPLDIIFKYLEEAANFEKPPIDAFIYIFQVSIKYECVQKSLPYIKKAFELEKPIHEYTLINHYFYDNLRWHLISIICLLTEQYLDIGKKAFIKYMEVEPNITDEFLLEAKKIYLNF
jgi:hypothetical protein